MTLNFQRNFLHGQKVSMSAAMIETGGGGVETDKNSRLLYLYEMLVHGEGLQKKEAAARFGVNERSIQRDIDCLRNFFASQEPPQEILYKAKEQRYELTSAAGSFLSCGELLAVCKILLDSRSMPKDEMEPILDKLLSRCASPQSRKLLGPDPGERAVLLCGAISWETALEPALDTGTGDLEPFRGRGSLSHPAGRAEEPTAPACGPAVFGVLFLSDRFY